MIIASTPATSAVLIIAPKFLTSVILSKIMINGLKALEAQGFEIKEGEELTEKARSVKGHDEILAMKCASAACENSVYIMEQFARNNVPKEQVSEDEIWAILHAENIKRGGEWIETRLLASGPVSYTHLTMPTNREV